MANPIKPEHLKQLRPLELGLQRAVRGGDVAAAEEALKRIQALLSPYGFHHRLLESRLWYFEGLLDANHVSVAESGFVGIRKRASRHTRLHIEASFFLAICYLRQKETQKAKSLIRQVLAELNKIQSAETRQLFQKRIIERLEEEAILTHLIGADEGPLREKEIHEHAIKLIQSKSEDEILELLARNIPQPAFALLLDVRDDAILQLPTPDRKLLPASGKPTPVLRIGQRTFAVLKRIGWKTLCDSNSPLFKLWSKKMPEVYSAAYFAGAVTKSFSDWRIGLPLLAAGVVAIAMKYSAQEFCECARPEWVMETRRKKEKR
jgi:hypothetical protein